MEVVIEKLVHGGMGLGRSPEGAVVFVERAYPGEIVIVEKIREKKDYIIGRVNTYIHRIPQRSAPLCKVYDECGGCDWLDYQYDDQLEAKTKILNEQFDRFLHLDIASITEPMIPSPEIYHYRNKMEYVHWHTPRGYEIGLRSRLDQLGAVPLGCKVAPKSFERIRQAVSRMPFISMSSIHHTVLRYSNHSGQVMLIWAGKQSAPKDLRKLASQMVQSFPMVSSVVYVQSSPRKAVLDGKHIALIGEPYLEETVCGFRYIIPSTAFFQINASLVEKMLQAMKRLWQPTSQERVLDLYGGVGLFSIFFSPLVKEITLVESNFAATSGAKKNQKIHQFNNITVETHDSLSYLKTQSPKRWDTIILDPPKAGAGKEVMSEICRLAPKTVLYVSCDAASLARDLGLLLLSGYRLNRLQPLDMFPHTAHFESVAVLEML